LAFLQRWSLFRRSSRHAGRGARRHLLLFLLCVMDFGGLLVDIAPAAVGATLRPMATAPAMS
jgi:hypothetical protein